MELQNWTGGFPPLVLSVLNHLALQGIRDEIAPDTMNNAARASAEGVAELLITVWENDCIAAAQELFGVLLERGELAVSAAGREEAQCLLSRGFAIQTGNKITPSCRMLQHQVQSRVHIAASLARQFGSWEGFRTGIRGILELRLKQIPIVNNRLHRLIQRSLDDIPAFPDDCLNNLTSIEEQALDVIWEHEFGAAKRIPADMRSRGQPPPARGILSVRRHLPARIIAMIPALIASGSAGQASTTAFRSKSEQTASDSASPWVCDCGKLLVSQALRESRSNPSPSAYLWK